MSDAPESTTPEQPNPATTDTTPDKGGQAETTPTFTQDDVNALMGKTRKEANESARKAILSDLGVEDLDVLKNMLTAAKEREEAEMSELEKMEQKLLKEQEARQKSERDMAALIERQRAKEREIAFMDAMRNAGGQDIKRLYILVNAESPEAFNALFDEETNELKTAQMEKFIKQVQSDYGNYFKTAGAGSPSASNGVVPSGNHDKKALNNARRTTDQSIRG